MMKSPSRRKADGEGVAIGPGGVTLPSPESGAGGSVGVKEEGDSASADAASRKSSAASESGRKVTVRLREPMVEQAGGPTTKGQLLEVSPLERL